jgi:hypothetical protein
LCQKVKTPSSSGSAFFKFKPKTASKAENINHNVKIPINSDQPPQIAAIQTKRTKPRDSQNENFLP